MKTTHASLPFAKRTLHFAEFSPANFCKQDLLWLPHYAQLQHTGRRRKTEHLAGRVATVYASREYDYKYMPAIDKLRQPVWPTEVYGNISYYGTTTSAVVSRQPVGIDIEGIFSMQTAGELINNIITPAEHERLANCGSAFSLALTLTFSAKESAFKASEIQADAGFLDYQIINWNEQQVIIHREDEMFAVHWQIREKIVIALCQHD